MTMKVASPTELGERFAQDHAALFHLIGHEVACCEGVGTLEQVFFNRATIRLDDGRVITETDLDTIVAVGKPKPASAPAAEDPAPGPFAASDEDLPELFFATQDIEEPR